ncbi:hypothetical protein DM02DRAFT_614577 [Periconia macrospinosa]|uniref:Uncharacterized protein n=1 Tax=Periconia macrospinosa TaxID=97972 RepID=A0A2V1DPX5_9PLEO|nr:hypothetical protein DM02DRAFT_614577 [Periconia macrospinosa]
MVASGDDKYSGPPAHVAAFLLLPNLRALYAWKAGDSETKDEDDPDAFFSNLPPRSISVEAVELRCAKLFHKHFSSLLSALTPGKLKTFQYEIGNSWAWTIVHHGRIMEALKPHYGTLENLELSHEDFYPYEYEGDDDILNIVPVSFRAFEKLRKLKVAPVYIWGHEKIRQGENGENTGEPLKANPEVTKPENREMLWKALPSTLEELGIMRADNAGRDESHISSLVLPALHILLDHASESFPLLKQIYVSFSTQDQTLEWLTDLHSLAVRAGNLGITVLIEITNCGYTFDSPAERRWGWYEDVEWEECINNLGNRLPRMVVAEQEDLFETLRGYGVPLPAEDDPEKGGEEPPMELAND